MTATSYSRLHNQSHKLQQTAQSEPQVTADCTIWAV